jgi:hypothetical protein
MVGYLTVFPSGTSAPLSSTHNFVQGQVIPNLVTAQLGAGPSGGISFLNGSAGTTHLVVDVVGYIAPDAPNGYVPLSVPYRDLDTRSGNGPITVGPVASSTTIGVDVGGANGVPRNAVGALMNTTVTDVSAFGFLTVYPSGVTRPPTSNLNFTPSATVANAVLTGLGAAAPNRRASVFASAGPIAVINDVQGYFAPLVASP